MDEVKQPKKSIEWEATKPPFVVWDNEEPHETAFKRIWNNRNAETPSKL